MPDIRYVFRAEDRTAGTIAAIRQRINSLGGSGNTVRVHVEPEGLDKTTQAIGEIPESISVRLDTEVGSEAGTQMIEALPESHSVVVDLTAGDQAGALAVRELPTVHGVVIDMEVGSEAGLAPLRGLPDSDFITVDYELGSAAGIEPIQTLPDSHTVRIDTVLGNAEGLLALQTIPENMSVTVDAVAGGTVSQDDLVTGGGGAGEGRGGTGLAVPAVAAGTILLGSQIVRIGQAFEERWMDQEQALADVSAMASSQFGGQALSAEQKTAAMTEAQRISQTYDISTGQALGVMYMGMQQGRTFEQMTTGGLGETMVQTAQSTKTFGATTVETLPYVLTALTDMIDVFPGTLEEKMETAQTVALGWVGGGKGDISNLGIAHGVYSGAAYAEGWDPEESMAFMLSGLGGFARVGSAATGMRNILRDVQTGQGREKWMEAAETAGFVDEDGGLTFLNEQGQMKPPLELMEELRKFNDPAIANQRSKLMFGMFTVEAKQFIDHLLATDSTGKFVQVMEQMGFADAATMATIKTDTAAGGAAVLEGRREDAMSQAWQMVGGPEITAEGQALENAIYDQVQEIFNFAQVTDALDALATPERFGFFQERGLASSGDPTKRASAQDYQIRYPMEARTEEGLITLNELLQEALAYQPSAVGVSADIQEMMPATHMGTRAPAQHALPGGRGVGGYDVVAGDTLGEIATSQGVSLDELLLNNPHIGDPNRIEVGQRINVPGAATGGPALTPEEEDLASKVPLPTSGPGLSGLGTEDPAVLAAVGEGIAAFVSMMTGILDPTTDASVEVSARVTELDTSAVENQIIDIQARLNVVGIPVDAGGGGKVRQDGSTQHRNAVSTSVQESERQRAGGAIR